MPPRDRESTLGVIYGLAAFVWWGVCPLYFKAVAHVAPDEVLAHRVLWSLLLLLVLLKLRGRLPMLRQALTHGPTARTLALTSALISVNWFVFIWAVGRGFLLEASLGYFINPLVNVLLGFVFLGERLRRLQTVSVILAALAVTWLTLRVGRVPVIALTLAFSFGFYGLLRKTVRADGMTGLTAETLLLAPFAAAWLLHLEARDALAFLHRGLRTDLLLPAAGVVTALPLVWYANAARRLRYATVGFLQYAAPSLQFLLAVVAFGEPFTRTHLAAFACIWTALGLYSWDSWRALRPVGGHRNQLRIPRI